MSQACSVIALSAKDPGRANGPYNAIDRDRPVLNQLYLVVEKALKATSGIDVGFRVDAMYGLD